MEHPPRTALDRLTLRMTGTLDRAAVLGDISRGLVEELGAALARIWLVRGESLELVASAGLTERLDGSHARVALGALKIGQIALSRKPVHTNDVGGDPRIVDKEWVADNSLVAFAGYPLLFREELLGVLGIFAARALGADDLERLEVFAAHASVALKNAQLFDEVSSLSRRLESENAYLRDKLVEPPAGIVGTSEAMRTVLREIERVAPTASTVLLAGETGTGKELFARAIHDLSPRRDNALVKVNCAALSPTLVESELFGHEKGAFTGASQRRLGRFELADGGTLFLDEIGELPGEAQAKLLRVLQEREVERVGGVRPVPVDIRIVCATNRDLAADVKAGRFRADLYFRLSVFPVTLPPLRARREDVPLLVDAFLRSLARKLGRPLARVDPAALDLLVAYDWPGNVRELVNVLERAAILAQGPVIGPAELPDFGRVLDRGEEAAGTANAEGEGSLRARVEAFERALVADALRASDNNQSEAARRLGMSRATFAYKVKAHGL
jgi:transcriptional regulator with GAF, ATPase, and Fis domain